VFQSDDGPLTITAPTLITGAYQTLYDLQFAQSGLDISAQGTIVTVTVGANSPVNIAFTSLPYDFGYVDAGTTVTYTCAATVGSSNSGEQFVLTTPSASPAREFYPQTQTQLC